MNPMKVNTSIANLREEPRPEGRRSSQLVFNDSVDVIEEKSDWILASGPDNYRGWIRKIYLDQFTLSGKEFKVSSLYAPVRDNENRLITRFTFGTRLRGTAGQDKLSFELSDGKEARIALDHLETSGGSGKSRWGFVDNLHRFIGVPYLWGGTTSFGFDCSGFVQRIFGYYGLELPRDADQQFEKGRKIKLKKLEQSKEKLFPSDLIFFEGHVGIYEGADRMVHSSRSENGVAVTDLSSKGQYLDKLGDIYLGARRLNGFQAQVEV
jgi:cell wall-associated NlpC family hydrolase